MKNTYGSSNCHFLQINSKNVKEYSTKLIDPWIQYSKFYNLKRHKNTEINELNHGNYLAPSDVDRIKTFITEFTVRGLIPWLERTLKILQDQIQSKRSILKTFGLQKKIFGSVSKMSSNSLNTALPSNNQQNVLLHQYPLLNEANENILRMIADLGFSFKMFEFSHSYYTMWKKEFSTDTSSINLAAAYEMISLSSFMQNSNLNKYLTTAYVEDAVNLLKTVSSKTPYYVIRFVLFITEVLKATNQHAKAAYLFLNITHEDDLISALFYEQAAFCFLHIQPPMIRKFAYYMTIAGCRYNENGKVNE